MWLLGAFPGSLAVTSSQSCQCLAGPRGCACKSGFMRAPHARLECFGVLASACVKTKHLLRSGVLQARTLHALHHEWTSHMYALGCQVSPGHFHSRTGVCHRRGQVSIPLTFNQKNPVGIWSKQVHAVGSCGDLHSVWRLGPG